MSGPDLRARLGALSPAQRERLAHRLGEGAPRAARLVAYAVPAGGGLDPEAVRDHLRRRLPAFMVPAAVVALDALPRTPNGKLDRAALPAPEAVAARPEAPPEAARLSAPDTPTEERLAAIWADVLGVDAVSVDDDFFEVGGDSILSIQIIARAKEAGLEIKTGDFFEHPTVRGLAAVLDAQQAREEATLVPLAPDGDRPPLFIVHGWGGKVFKYRELAQGLGADQPVYGIQDVDHDDPADRFPTFEAMVEHYVREVRAVQPHGPYSFLGFSVGGTIAYAMAAALREAGEPVGRIFVLDTVPYNLPPRVHFQVMLPFMRQRLRHHLGEVARAPGNVVRVARRLAGTFRSQFQPPPEVPDQPLPEVIRGSAGDYYRQLMRYYVPPRCPVPVTLVKATRVTERYDFGAAWRYLTGAPPEVAEVEGSHDEFLGDARGAVADAVRAHLDRDHARTAAPPEAWP